MNQIGILKYYGATGDHDLYWAVKGSCGEKAVFLEPGDWTPDHVSALLIPEGAFVSGYSDKKDIHLISKCIYQNKPVLAIGHGFMLLKIAVGLSAGIIYASGGVVQNLQVRRNTGKDNFWVQGLDSQINFQWNSSFRCGGFDLNGDPGVESLLESNGRIWGVGLIKRPVAAFCLHPERAVDALTGNDSGTLIFKRLKGVQ